MLTPTEVENATTAEWARLSERIDAELTRRELAEREHPRGHQVVEERSAKAGTLRLEMVKCGKARCKKCQEGPSHGPYFYYYYRRNGKLASRYIGKRVPAELEA